MSDAGQRNLTPGHPPWDSWSGARVGILFGSVVGILLVVLAGSTAYWLGVIPAALGGAIGFWSQTPKTKENSPLD